MVHFGRYNSWELRAPENALEGMWKSLKFKNFLGAYPRPPCMPCAYADDIFTLLPPYSYETLFCPSLSHFLDKGLVLISLLSTVTYPLPLKNFHAMCLWLFMFISVINTRIHILILCSKCVATYLLLYARRISFPLAAQLNQLTVVLIW